MATSRRHPVFSALDVAENADGVDYGESQSPPQVRSNETEPSEIDESRPEQRHEKAVTAGRLEA
jgi:hypothetical protein